MASVAVVVATCIWRHGRVENVEGCTSGLVLQRCDDVAKFECANEGEGGHLGEVCGGIDRGGGAR